MTTTNDLLSPETLAEIQMRQAARKELLATGHTFDPQTAVWDTAALLAHAQALQAQLERGALCEECDQWEYNEDGSCRTYTVCGACWNKRTARLREVEQERDKLTEAILTRFFSSLT